MVRLMSLNYYRNKYIFLICQYDIVSLNPSNSDDTPTAIPIITTRTETHAGSRDTAGR